MSNTISTEKFLEIMNMGEPVRNDSNALPKMSELSQRALRITMELNNAYHTPDEVRSLMEQLIGQELDESFGMFPPFYTDCGRNIHIGKGVFINAGCKFQDQGGIYIGDGALIGHNAMLATLNHGMLPEERQYLIPKPIHIGKNVWIGSNSTILPGVTIGDNAVIGAGSVVTKDIPENMLAVGSPAKVIRSIFEGK